MIIGNTNNTYMYQTNSRSVSNPVFKGWKPDSVVKRRQLQEIVDVITDPKSQRIAISGHNCPDGDCIGACFALSDMIQQSTNKKVDLFIFGDIPHKYKFLNNGNVNLINIYGGKEYKADKLTEKHGKYDVAISLDTALERLIPDSYYEGIFSKADKTIKIDHHPYTRAYDKESGIFSDNNFADYNYIDEKSDSASQIVMQLVELFKLKPQKLPKRTSEAIYTGLLTDTNCFRYTRSDKTFTDASLLLRNGVNNIDIQSRIVGNISPSVHRIRQYLYNNVEYSPSGEIAYFKETDELLKLKSIAGKEGAKEEAQEEVGKFLDYLLNLKNIEMCIKMSGTTFSVRSKNIDVSTVANKYGGGGHKNAAAFCIKKDSGLTSDEILQKVLTEYEEQLKTNKEYIKEKQIGETK